MCIVQLRQLSELLLQIDQMSEVKEGRMLLARVEVIVALSIFKQVATKFAAYERGSKVMINNLLYSAQYLFTISCTINVSCLFFCCEVKL